MVANKLIFFRYGGQMEYSWILPVAEKLYQNREEIQNNFQKITNRLSGEKSKIVITGLPGVGKTVLSDYLTDVAYKRGYTSPLQSDDLEKRSTSIQKQRLDFKVIPGQGSPQRNNALDEFFEGNENPAIDGVIHVVANGMSRLGNDFSQEFRRGSSLQAYQQDRLIEEVEDLRQICELVRKSIRKNRQPSWLLVAVTKVDLYYDSIETARDRYSIQGQSDFSDQIKILSNQVGSDNFRWDALPFCGRLDDFILGSQTYSPQLREHQRDHYIAQFSKKLVAMCKAKS
jgi:GTPase SAR1 family protein